MLAAASANNDKTHSGTFLRLFIIETHLWRDAEDCTFSMPRSEVAVSVDLNHITTEADDESPMEHDGCPFSAKRSGFIRLTQSNDHEQQSQHGCLIPPRNSRSSTIYMSPECCCVIEYHDRRYLARWWEVCHVCVSYLRAKAADMSRVPGLKSCPSPRHSSFGTW